jgi:hypothetical protein
MSARTSALLAVCGVAIVVLLIVFVPKLPTPTPRTTPTPPPVLSWQCEDALARRRTAEAGMASPDLRARSAVRTNYTRANTDVRRFCPE